jgi:hypothetical protein
MCRLGRPAGLPRQRSLSADTCRAHADTLSRLGSSLTPLGRFALVCTVPPVHTSLYPHSRTTRIGILAARACGGQVRNQDKCSSRCNPNAPSWGSCCFHRANASIRQRRSAAPSTATSSWGQKTGRGRKRATRENGARKREARRRENGRVERWRGGVGFDIILFRGFPGCVSIVACRAPFPPPAHRTGRADFPHPALGQGSWVRRRRTQKGRESLIRRG